MARATVIGGEQRVVVQAVRRYDSVSAPARMKSPFPFSLQLSEKMKKGFASRKLTALVVLLWLFGRLPTRVHTLYTRSLAR